jgi:hypothetical protein
MCAASTVHSMASRNLLVHGTNALRPSSPPSVSHARGMTPRSSSYKELSGQSILSTQGHHPHGFLIYTA